MTDKQTKKLERFYAQKHTIRVKDWQSKTVEEFELPIKALDKQEIIV